MEAGGGPWKLTPESILLIWLFGISFPDQWEDGKNIDLRWDVPFFSRDSANFLEINANAHDTPNHKSFLGEEIWGDKEKNS